MAYAALISLKRTLLDGFLLSSADLDCEKHKVESLVQNLDFLHGFLEAPYPPPNSHQRKDFEARIRDAIYQAQDIVDIHHVSYGYSVDSSPFGDLKSVIREIDSIKEEIQLTMMKKDEVFPPPIAIHDSQPDSYKSLRANFGSDSKSLMVGYDDLSLQIKDQLTGESSSSLQIISLVGMGGIGKTTLAINTYNDSYIVGQFDIRGWVTVSQSYSARNIFLDLLDSMKLLPRDVRNHSDDDCLASHLHKCLKEKRYFIVIDDVWDTDAWDAVRRMFPKDSNGSGIMLTTRITDVAAYATTSSDSIYQMPLLRDDSSWVLLRAKVFGSEFDQPPDFEEIGKDIARKCRGLPLSVAVMAGLLSKVDKTYEAWEAVAANLTTSLLSSSDDLISSEILKMSYNYLPQHLKSCFLYIGIFPEDHEIDVTKLVNLWIAEGFLDRSCNESSIKEEAERYLRELIDRSLLSKSKMKPNGKMKTCRIHDLLLDLCVKESLSEKILQVTKWDDKDHLFPEISTGQRRLSVHQKGNFNCITPPTSSSLIRSLICVGKHDFPHGVFRRFKLLRVLDLIQVIFDEFPEKVTKLVKLRYLAFRYKGKVPSSLSKLFYLQTLLINAPSSKLFESLSDLYLPSEIWKMKHLRHIQFDLANPEVDDEIGVVLEELQTIKGAWDLVFTEELIRRIPNITKLSVKYRSLHSGWYEIENLANLHQLKELTIHVDQSEKLHGSRFRFPESLETLSLSGTKIPWSNLSSLVGSLPRLRVLKLKAKSCVGEVWEAKEGDFCELKVLEFFRLNLRRWKSEPQHFPRLEHIIARSCPELRRIPISWGESSSLNKIQLLFVPRSLIASANEIKAIQCDYGNEDFQVIGPTIK